MPPKCSPLRSEDYTRLKSKETRNGFYSASSRERVGTSMMENQYCEKMRKIPVKVYRLIRRKEDSPLFKVFKIEKTK